MDIQALGILSSIAAQGNTNTIVDKGNNLSFSQIFSEIKGTNQISAKDMFSAAFPTNDVSVKARNCDISSEIWERKDFPIWQYFQDDVSTNSLNNWKLSGAQPTGAESYIQQELKKIGFGEIVVMFPESLQNKMEANPEYAQEIAEKLQKWKTNYDRMDNAVAASYGDDPILYQMTKSYCIQLDEDGNHVIISPAALSKMENNPVFKEKVLNDIEEFCSPENQAGIRALQPPVKSAGMIVYPDGRALYWIEGYPNEIGSEKSKKIVNENSISELLQMYSNADNQMLEKDFSTFMQIMATGYKRQDRNVL